MESDKTLKYTCYLLAEESFSKNYLGFLDYLKLTNGYYYLQTFTIISNFS
jgi:hypothetical protein